MKANEHKTKKNTATTHQIHGDERKKDRNRHSRSLLTDEKRFENEHTKRKDEQTRDKMR